MLVELSALMQCSLDEMDSDWKGKGRDERARLGSDGCKELSTGHTKH